MPTGYPDTRYKRYGELNAKALAVIAEHKMPAAIAGATWQSGRTPNHGSYRPLLDGEAVPGAIACRVTDGNGWLDYTTPGQRTSDDADYEPVGEIRRMFGHVELVRDPY